MTKSISQIRNENLRLLINHSFSDSQADFSRQTGIALSQIGQWLSDSDNSNSRNMSEKSARKIERLTHMPAGWLDTDNRGKKDGHDANVSAGPVLYKPVPLISWVQAGDWCGVVDNFAPGDADDWLPVPRAHGPNAYALRVRGISMEPRYQDGSIIFVDPSKQADHGSNVVVRMDNEAEATFKQLVVEGENKFLRALNPDWPGPKLIEIKSNATICGVVIGQFIPD